MEIRNLVHLELLRILGIYLVLFNHTGNLGFFYFSVAQKSHLYWWYLFLSIACKIGVPLFFMISGALLLKKEESIGSVYKKRVLRMVIILVVTSFCYQLYDTGWAAFSLNSFLIRLYSRNFSVALWYLYAYIGLLMMLPLLRKLAKNLTCREYVYLAGMSLLFVGIIPILQYRLGLDKVLLNGYLRGILFTGPLGGTTTSAVIVFFLMGYFFEHILPEKYYTWKNACIGIILSLICIAICCYMTHFRAVVMGKCAENISQVFHNSLIAIPTYTVYFTGKLLFMKHNISQGMQKAICLVGSTTLGIFLMERVLRDETKIVFITLKPMIKTMAACLVWILVALIVGFIITLIIKKVPIIGKYI